MKKSQATTKAPRILSGWKEIANYLGKGVRTVQRYERQLGLPVRRPAGKPWGSVVATIVEIDAWVAASPIRNELQLLRPTTDSASATWKDIQSGAAEMNRLAKQMVDLRAELSNSVRLLRKSIRDVQGGLNKEEWGRRIEDRVAQTRSLFNMLYKDAGAGARKLMYMDTTGRKVS